MYDKFSDTTSSPARLVYLITPSASTPIEPLPKAIRAGTAGTITFRAVDSTVDVVMSVVTGEILPIRAQFIRVAGTTVTTIHGLA
jgi:hypothetical protein